MAVEEERKAFYYRPVTPNDLEAIWNKNIADNPVSYHRCGSGGNKKPRHLSALGL